ncbi:MAG: hypothetical protein RLZZ180_1391 [Pseudomonadota bacterium]|jgi:putative ubiquitin-RnfH superfamily antitoxin RatB of RatAB toxin-antitoxin module
MVSLETRGPCEPGAKPQAVMPISVVACLGPRQVQEWELQLPEGATVAQALQACGLAPPPVHDPQALGVWGRRCGAAQALKPGDRVELYRPLRVDPKVARRERFKGQGARTAGLFAKRRPGAKPGY